jgi:hypothetical protein
VSDMRAWDAFERASTEVIRSGHYPSRNRVDYAPYPQISSVTMKRRIQARLVAGIVAATASSTSLIAANDIF